MKQYLLIFLILFSFQSMAQPKLGLKFSPSLISNRVNTSADTISVLKDGIAIRPSFGLLADFMLSDNYYFSTGLMYIPKTVKLLADPINDSPYSNRYTAQYLQVPITIKLFTNEIDIDKRLYFQIGVNAEFMIYNEHKTENEPKLIRRFIIADAPLVFSAGMETYLGTNTILMLGASYHRGMVNVVGRENFGNRAFSVRNDIFAIDIGVKF